MFLFMCSISPLPFYYNLMLLLWSTKAYKIKTACTILFNCRLLKVISPQSCSFFIFCSFFFHLVFHVLVFVIAVCFLLEACVVKSFICVFAMSWKCFILLGLVSLHRSARWVPLKLPSLWFHLSERGLYILKWK